MWHPWLADSKTSGALRRSSLAFFDADVSMIVDSSSTMISPLGPTFT